MQITFYGAAGEVTGSRHLVRVGQENILLDCGMFQGHRPQGQFNNEQLPFAAQDITAVVLSHGHLDHCGSLPTLVRSGFRGRIYATHATRDVAELIMRDSAKIQEQDADYHNRHRLSQEAPLQPLYRESDVDAVMPLFETLEYNECRKISQHAELCFSNSGHILGSALTQLTLEEEGRHLRLAYTGDLGQKEMPILNGPQALSSTDVLIAESTYGQRRHEALPESAEKLAAIIRDTVARKGKIFVPAFALGRMQTLIYTLHKLTDEGKIPHIPIYVDSPLAVNMTAVFVRHPECFDEEARKLFIDRGDKPFQFANLHFVSSVEESKQLNVTPGPMMILATSGMAEAGRILHHFMNGLDDPNNTVLFVGYLAQGTLGRAILEGAKQVQIFHRHIPVRATVMKLNAYSAHADQTELVDFITAIQGLQRVFLVHGDDEARTALQECIHQQKPQLEVTLPTEGSHYEVAQGNAILSDV